MRVYVSVSVLERLKVWCVYVCMSISVCGMCVYVSVCGVCVCSMYVCVWHVCCLLFRRRCVMVIEYQAIKREFQC